ncbi:MAG: hypothetical protein WC620_10660 [Methanoregula sp.]|jgi:hypothetical protein
MINNDEELESTKKALDLAERALIALKKKVYPINPQKYSLLAEPYLEYINRLRAEKDEYIGLYSAEELAMPIWIRLKGPHMEEGNVPIEVLSKFLNNFKWGFNELRSSSTQKQSERVDAPTKISDDYVILKQKFYPGVSE